MPKIIDREKALPSIYGLLDADGEIRYIGKANVPLARLKTHMLDAPRRDTPVYRWIREIGLPRMVIIAENVEDWESVERSLIAEHRAKGCRLLNVADGGEQPFCPSEVRASNGRAVSRAIHSDPARKRVWEIKHAISIAMRDGFVTDVMKDKMRMIAAKRPDLFGSWSAVQ